MGDTTVAALVAFLRSWLKRKFIIKRQAAAEAISMMPNRQGVYT